MKKEMIFLDIDTQYDFMRPEGRLYVAGAEGIIENVSEARKFAMSNSYSTLATMDWHKEGNPEISDRPDFKTTFPSHCMAGEKGSQRVGYLGEIATDFVPNEEMEKKELREMLDKQQFHIVLRKEELNPFSNPNTRKIIEMLEPEKIIVFGVALDLCVRQTVEGLSEMGGIQLYLLRDAVKGLGTRTDDEVIADFVRMGVEIISVGDLEERFGRG